MARVHERGLRWDELTVADVMIELSMLDAIPLDSMRSASVNNVIATLQRFGRNHLLVVEPVGEASAGQRVRGVISRSQVERQLGRPVEVTPIATTFAEIERALV
jgi:hypothetical protein